MPTRTHRAAPTEPRFTDEEWARIEADTAFARVQFRQPVRVSYTLSCGHRGGPGEIVEASEANWMPGSVVICDAHDEFAVVTRVTIRLVATREVLFRLLVAHGIDEVTAEALAEDQAA